MSDTIMRVDKSSKPQSTESPGARVVEVVESELWKALKSTRDDPWVEIKLGLSVMGGKVKLQVQQTRSPGWLNPGSERFYEKYVQPGKHSEEPPSNNLVGSIIDRAIGDVSRFFWGAIDQGQWSDSANHTLTLIVKRGTITGKQQVSHDQMFPDGIAGIS
jgi:hypothetical protein